MIIKKPSFESVLIVLLIFTSVDTILFGTNESLIFRLIPRIVGLLASLYFFIKFLLRKNRENIKIMLTAFCLLLGLFSISSVINNNPFDGTISRLVSIICGFSIALCVKREVFLDTFKKAIFFICLVALFTELFAYAFPGIIRLAPVVINTSGRKFYVFFIGAFGFDNMTQVLKRSMGIFWEPGAFSIYIVLALAMELFSRNKKWSRIIIDVIALLLTFSTTGYVAFAFLVLVYALFKVNVKKVFTKLIIVLVLVCFVVIFTSNNNQLGQTLFGKIIEGNSSSATRFSSFFNGLYLAFNKPVFGLGTNSSSTMALYIASGNAKFTNGGIEITNTITGFMVYYGIPFSIIIMVGSYLFFKHFSKYLFVAFLLFVVLLLGYFGERFFSFLPFVIAFYGFKKEKKHLCTTNYENNC